MLDTTTRLTDDGVVLFDRAVGRMLRRAEAGEKQAALRDARAVNAKVRLLAKQISNLKDNGRPTLRLYTAGNGVSG